MSDKFYFKGNKEYHYKLMNHLAKKQENNVISRYEANTLKNLKQLVIDIKQWKNNQGGE